MRYRILAVAAGLFVILAAGASEARAQRVTIGAGLGGVLNERRDLPDELDDLNHKLAFASLKLPMIPLALRVEGLWPDDPTNDNARAIIGSAVLEIPLVIVTPYAQAGWGDYNFGDPDREKWSLGLGARLNLGTLGIFVEATRYNRMPTDLISAGLALSFGAK